MTKLLILPHTSLDIPIYKQNYKKICTCGSQLFIKGFSTDKNKKNEILCTSYDYVGCDWVIWSDQSLSLSLFCVCRIVDMIKRRRKDDRYTFLAAKKSSFTWKKKKKRVAFATVFCNMVCDPVFWSPGISCRIYPYAYDNGKLCIYKVENKPHKCPPLQTVSLLAKPFNSAIIILFKSVCVFKQPLLSTMNI